MKQQALKENVVSAIATLRDKDNFLLKHDISEWAISHKLAVYLNDKFPGLDVDCEYNGYANADNHKKYLMILHSRLKDLGQLRDSDSDGELLKRSVFPDIIVHKRGKNSNLLIIEVKKAGSSGISYDREKLCRYTSPKYQNDLNYQLGALVIFTTGREDPAHEIEWYENGSKI